MIFEELDLQDPYNYDGDLDWVLVGSKSTRKVRAREWREVMRRDAVTRVYVVVPGSTWVAEDNDDGRYMTRHRSEA